MRANRSSSASDTVATVAPTSSRLPPVFSRRTGGMRIGAHRPAPRRGLDRLATVRAASTRRRRPGRPGRARCGPRRRWCRPRRTSAAGRPASRPPRARSLKTSLACSRPTIPGSTPSTPATLAAGRQLGRRLGRVHAAVARPVERDEGRDLAVPAVDRAVDHRLAQLDGRVVQHVARVEVVRPVDDHVVVGDQPLDVVGVQALVVLDDARLGIQAAQRQLGRVDLASCPTRSVACSTWRWRLDSSTTSSSTRPIVPTPEAVR